MMRVLITGAGGFTGRFVAQLLIDQGFDVYGTVTSESESVLEVSRRRVVDLLDILALERLIAEIRPEKVIHLAGIAFVAHDEVHEIYLSNIMGTRNLLQSLIDANVRPSSIVLASSANVYGNVREGVLDENAPVEPANDYAVSKVAMELMARTYRERLPITIVRPFNYTGRGQSPNFLIPKIVDHARRRAEWIELGNLDVWRDFSDVRFVAQVYAKLIVLPSAAGQVFNICSGSCHSLREIITLVEKLSGHSMEVRVNPAFVRANEVRIMQGDPALLQESIGPIENPPIKDTLAWMLNE